MDAKIDNLKTVQNFTAIIVILLLIRPLNEAKNHQKNRNRVILLHIS